MKAQAPAEPPRHVKRGCVELCRRLLQGEPIPAGTLTAERKDYRELVLREVHALHGLNLACWCKPGTPCHADVLLALAEGDRLRPENS
ncbi:MAG: DUF4326 domain-containing protein [Flavobacteriales bacterium]|nr:DUF4326 domain-containing protein [Flavobacteriales bacterium]